MKKRKVNNQKMKETHDDTAPLKKPRQKCESIVKTMPYSVYSWQAVENAYGETFTTMCVHVNYAIVTRNSDYNT